MHLQQIQINNLMLQSNQIQTKSLKQIIRYVPNLLTAFRFGLNYLAAVLFPTSPEAAGAVLMLSVIFDYFDGMAARKFKQCSFFGDIFDWITDVLTLAIVLFWWNNIEPQFIIFFFSLLCLDIMTMVADLISKSAGCQPKLTSNTWTTMILRYTMNIQKRGYSGKGIGYWNQIFYFTCMVSRILYVITQNDVYLYLCAVCVPLGVSYVWMHFAFTVNILEKWSEEYEENEIKLKFIEQ